MSTQSNLNTEQLPHWMGQITLKGVVTDRVSCNIIVLVALSTITDSAFGAPVHLGDIVPIDLATSTIVL